MNITLGEVGTYINGYAFKPSDWGTSGLPIIRIQNLTNQNTVPNYFDGPYNSKFEVNKGDILIAWSGSLGIHIWQKNKALLNQHIFRVEFNKCDIDKMYFYYAVKYNIHKMLHLTHGATMRHIIKSDFEQIIIPYPRLEIQVKISKVLNYLDQNIINYKNILIKLELLIKSRFVEMFGDPNASRTKYKLVPIHMVTDCMVPGRDKPKSFTGEIPWITINDLNINGYTNKSKLGLGLTIDEVKEVNRKCVPQGSVLMSCVGNLGLCSIASVDVVINQQLHSYQCNEFINNLYLMYYLSFKNTYMNKIASSTTVLYMNKNACNNIPVLLPPIELQISFAKYLNQINKLKSDVQKSIDETQLLMDSLMQEYFG